MIKKGIFWFLVASFFLGFCQSGTVAKGQDNTGKAFVGTRDFKSLNGSWQIIFDRNNEGREKKWTHKDNFPEEGMKDITVPVCWELIEKDYEGVAFYRRIFRVPADWQGRTVRLHFDAVNFRAEVWLNNTAVGFHEGGFTPFEFEVSDLLKSDKENTLIVRVVGPVLMQDKTIDGMGKMETPQWRGAITGGIWQPVILITTGEVYVKDVFIEPRITDNTARVNLDLKHTGASSVTARVDLAIHPVNRPDQVAANIQQTWKLKPGSNKQSWTVKIPGAQYWSPDNPFLYRTNITITIDGEVSDQWNTRFGMREFTIRDKKFWLNGKPVYLKAAFFEGLYPTRLAYPDSRQMAIQEIQLAKDAGFNMIRPWRKPPPPMWLDLADSMGVLTIGSLAIECMDFPSESAQLPRWVENEVQESILRDRNRACVVQWELFNELKRPVLKRLLHPMTILARELDPTRLILDESGGWAQGANIFLPYESEPIKFNDIHDYPGPQINEEVYNKLLLAGRKTHAEMREMGLSGRLPGRNVVPGLMTYFSELGYGSLPDLVDNNKRFSVTGNPIAPPTIYHRRLADQHRKALKESGFDQIYPDLEKFCRGTQQIHGTANKRMIEAVRCNPNVRGYCVHALTAGDWIMGAGLLDLFRHPKDYVYDQTKAANQPCIVSIRIRPRNVYAGCKTDIEITGVNESDPIQGMLKIEISDSGGKMIFAETIQALMASGITQLFSLNLDTKELRGTCNIKAGFMADHDSLVAGNTYSFDVFAEEDLAVSVEPIAVIDPGNLLKPFLEVKGIDFVDFDTNTDHSLPVFVSPTEANTPVQENSFRELELFISEGGTAVYMHGDGLNAPFGNAGKAPSLLPVHARLKQARGNWNCIPHLILEHPLMDGLPVNCMMGPVYENVWAKSTLLDIDGETVVGSIGYDWFPDYDRSRRHYHGPGDTWWGSDLSVIPLGKGRCIISTLRIIQNLNEDPVADILFYNMMDYATGPGKAMGPSRKEKNCNK